MKIETIHLAGRVDQIVRDYFEGNPTQQKIQAKELMPLFIEKGIFEKNHRDGLPIRKLLRELEDNQLLSLIHNCQAERKKINTNWFFFSETNATGQTKS